MAKLRIEQVAILVGVSTQTLNRWYKFKRENPEDEVSKQLPDYDTADISRGLGYIRLWESEDVWKLIEFKQNVHPGRSGRMGKYGGRGTHGKNNCKEGNT